MKITTTMLILSMALSGCGGGSSGGGGQTSSSAASSSSSQVEGYCPASQSQNVASAQSYTRQSLQDRILVFSKTEGFRHDSIGAGKAMLQTLADDNGWLLELTEDSSLFNADELGKFAVVVWLNTTGDVLNATEQAAFEDYIENGGGYVGIHSAADTEYDWPWYGNLVGAYFQSHPHNQTATVEIEQGDHPATEHLNASWSHFDEWYNFQSNPRDRVNVLLSVDENSYSPGEGAMGDHPIAWYHSIESGRAFYSGLGHTSAAYSDPDFIAHIEGGLIWAGRLGAKVPEWDGPPPPDSDFSTSYLAVGINEPMVLEISAQNDFYVIGRRGEFYALEDDQLVLKSTIITNSVHEGGLIGFVLDPNFVENRHAYFHYTDNTEALHHISRITLHNDNSLNLASEKILLSYEVDLQRCCHLAGDMAFDAEGNLYIATGDNTDPFESNGYAPLDERANRELFDAQRTSANTNDLRGKILRIKPTEEGSYTIPEGNLFATDALHRGEIFSMGHRNPYRISIDSGTGLLFWGEIGPDANFETPSRGPGGYDEINKTAVPGNFGWPYFAGPNEAYNRYDFASASSGAKYNPNNVRNESVNNTGATDLPDAEPAWITMSHRALMLGDVYRWNPEVEDSYKLPSYFNGRLISWNFNNDALYEVPVDAQNPSQRSWLDTSLMAGIIDAEISPVNNRLYLLGYGGNCCGMPANAGMLAEVLYIGDGPPDSQEPPPSYEVGDTVTFTVDNKLLSSSAEGELSLLDNRTGNREIFEIVEADNNTVALRSFEFGMYVSTAGANLSATAGSIGREEQFYLDQKSDGSYTLKAAANCLYVGLNSNAGTSLVANASTIGERQLFKLAAAEPCTSDSSQGLACRQSATAYLNMPAVVDGELNNLPALLSQTGAFAEVSTMTPSASLIPYEVITPLWSDRAGKRRWVAIPNGSRVDWAATGKWQWPAGTVFVKHFELPVDESNPEQIKRLETRLLVVRDGGQVYGATYKWRADHSDADLLTDTLNEDIVISSPNGDWTQTWTYPSPTDCQTCHNPEAEGVLGVKTASINKAWTYPNGVTENQLRAWNNIGLFSSDIEAQLNTNLPEHAALNDTDASSEHRLRSYWDANCANCHGPQGIASLWDARFETPLTEQGIVNGELAGQRDYLELYGLEDPKVIDPGNKDNSILYIRSHSTDPDHRMPPLGTHLVDENYIEVLEGWIADLEDQI